jgi:hypothetical protein
MMLYIDPLMQNPTLRCKEVFFPQLLQMYQGILPLTEQYMLQCRNGN